MAIINCPSCSKRVSDKAPTCQHCGLDLQNIDEQKLQSIKRINILKKSQQLMTMSFVAMLLFCGGFFAIYWSELSPESYGYVAAVSAIVIGVALYLYARVQIIILKRNLK